MRLSVTSIVLFLLLITSTLILGLGYSALNKILLTAVNKNLEYSIEKIGQQIDEYFLPLTTSNKRALELFRDNIVKPESEYSDKMMRLLHATNRSEDNLSGAFWWNTFGDFFYLDQPKEREGVEEILIFDKNHGNKTIQKFYDKNQHLIKVETINKALFYTKPWYQKAVEAKKPICVIFPFAELGSQKQQLGVASAFPVYDKNGVLLGIFGINMLVENIATYIKNLTVTKNSLVFTINDIGETLIRSSDSTNTSNSTDNNLSLKQKSFANYKKTQKAISTFVFNGKKYISAYEKISALKTDSAWFIAIITPMDDVIKPLRDKIFIDLILIATAIVIGLLLASLFSVRISTPIKALAQDLNLICNLRLNEVKGVVSTIKEVAEMNDAFMRMKNALTSFQRYMPLALVKKLIANNKVAIVGGENKQLTIMFTAIEDFTKLSENMEPQKLMQYLSRYSQIITKIIIDNDGNVDKYINGGVMAFWGAPIEDEKHALHACQAALKIQEALKQFNQENEKSGEPIVITHIGINTGNVVVGNMGSDDRLNYTSLGDNVNLTSRIERLNRLYKTLIITSEYTYNQTKDQFKFRFLDKVIVKGKQHGVRIYTLMGSAELEPNLDLEQYNQELLMAFSCYEEGNWQKALDLFNALDKKYPNNEVIKISIKRCTLCIKTPPKNWTGAWELTEK